MGVVIVGCGWLQANPADIDSSGVVDFTDLTIFVAAWCSDDTPTVNWNPACDISNPNDGFIDGLDFAVLSANWLWPRPNPNEFAHIPAGTFEMGDHHDGIADALPVHIVTLDSFYMSKYEITNQQYCDYLNNAYPAQIKVAYGNIVYAADDDSNSYPYCILHNFNAISQINFSGSVFSVNVKDGTTDMSEHPILMVFWDGALAYCNWKSQQEGLESCYDVSTWECDFTKNGYRLPTEAEWEYAARGGNHSPYYRFPWGDSIAGSMANYWGSGDPYETGVFPYTSPVGYYDGGQIPTGVDMANGYGLYDMGGNVREWCNDWYDENYYSTSVTNNPTGPLSGINRVLRGGMYTATTIISRVAYRHWTPHTNMDSNLGFRVCVFASH